jgi:hypothetical protein
MQPAVPVPAADSVVPLEGPGELDALPAPSAADLILQERFGLPNSQRQVKTMMPAALFSDSSRLSAGHAWVHAGWLSGAHC